MINDSMSSMKLHHPFCHYAEKYIKKKGNVEFSSGQRYTIPQSK